MFTVEELNREMRLDYPRHKIVEWSPMHFRLCDYNDFDRNTFRRFPNYMELLEHYIRSGVAYTAICDGEVLAMWGAWDLWDGVSEAWLIPSRNVDRKTISFHRGALLFFDLFCRRNRTKRLQIHVCSANLRAVRWAERCYFEKEGVLRNYGPGGEDYIIYARVFDD